MTPLDMAQSFARSDDQRARVIGVAMVTRSLTDDDPATLRAGWPLDSSTVRRAAQYLGLGMVSEDFVDEVLMAAPTISDAMLNRSTR